ncbi:MAG: chorismate synthase [Atopobiaceae bacterium]|nr:chorismate synthase [Atopobiaceae bacterium]
MASNFGNSLRVSIFGQSHSPAVGCVIEGLPAGFAIDFDELASFMARRAGGQGRWTTPRKETDAVRVLSGLNHDNMTCGAPLALMIESSNTRPQDYDNLKHIPRPGHADWVAHEKWNGHQDGSGGGHFSGRLTAPVCAAGGIAKQLLASRGVAIAAHLAEVAGIADEAFCARELDDASQAQLAQQIETMAAMGGFPTLDDEVASAMLSAIEQAAKEGDSVGGIVECVSTGLPAGIGGPMFDGIESLIARIAFGIGAVKGIEFGAGFSAARMRGSEDNDPYQVQDGRISLAKNDCGGNLGGISTATPVVFRLAIKPTSSISIPQQSVDLATAEQAELVVRGRHDPCIAPRAVPVAEAIMALGLLDAWLSFPAQDHGF